MFRGLRLGALRAAVVVGTRLMVAGEWLYWVGQRGLYRATGAYYFPRRDPADD